MDKSPIDNPLTSRMREETRMELRKSWFHFGEEVAGYCLKRCWTSEWIKTVVDGSTTSTDEIDSVQLREVCNKPTALYWAHSAQVDDRCPRLIFGCIYREWFRYHNLEPRLDFGHFFANPVRITSTGPTTISGILTAHEHLCNQTLSLLEKIRRDETGKPDMSASSDPQIYRLLPLCRAIIIVLDGLAPDDGLDPDGLIFLDNELQRQNVLMVRTSDESGLSEQINFESVREQALPLARPDVQPHDGIDAIRVTLATAVRFVVDLERREEQAQPESALSLAVDPSLCAFTLHGGVNPARIMNADAWIDHAMELADEKGIENVREVRDAVLRVKAAQRGESCLAGLMPPHFDGRWR